MRTTLEQLAASALVGALLAGVATGVIDPTALARALAEVVGDLGGWAYAAVGSMAFLETGFELDHSFVQLPVFDTNGRPVHQRGVTASPGLYFLGMPWQHTRGSALLGSVKDDAQYIADQIATLASTGMSPAAPVLAAEPPQR